MAGPTDKLAGRPGEPTGPFTAVGFHPPSPQELSSRLPNLEVLEILGQGGMGVVYKGRQPLLERNVAVKVVRPDLVSNPESQQRFLTEARAGCHGLYSTRASNTRVEYNPWHPTPSLDRWRIAGLN